LGATGLTRGKGGFRPSQRSFFYASWGGIAEFFEKEGGGGLMSVAPLKERAKGGGGQNSIRRAQQ